MSASLHQLYVHLVWTTALREPWLHPAIRPALAEYLNTRARALPCAMLGMAALPDHVHALVRLHASVDVSRRARELKAPSSGLSRRHFRVPGFAWQTGYGAFTGRRGDLPRVLNDLRDQPRHHAEGTLFEVLEATPPEDT